MINQRKEKNLIKELLLEDVSIDGLIALTFDW